MTAAYEQPWKLIIWFRNFLVFLFRETEFKGKAYIPKVCNLIICQIKKGANFLRMKFHLKPCILDYSANSNLDLRFSFLLEYLLFIYLFIYFVSVIVLSLLPWRYTGYHSHCATFLSVLIICVYSLCFNSSIIHYQRG